MPPTSSFAVLRSAVRAARPTQGYSPISARLSQQTPNLKQSLRVRFSSSDASSSPSTTSYSPIQTQTPTQIPTPPSKTRPAHAPPPKSKQAPLAYPSKPEYEMTFTCKPCSTRSTHRVSKQGYHYGSVLITCPECRNRHAISDHLNIFGDKHLTIEDLMREQGQLVKRGTLSEDGDLEFWVDGSVTKRGEGAGADAVRVGEDAEGQERASENEKDETR